MTDGCMYSRHTIPNNIKDFPFLVNYENSCLFCRNIWLIIWNLSFCINAITFRCLPLFSVLPTANRGFSNVCTVCQLKFQTIGSWRWNQTPSNPLIKEFQETGSQIWLPENQTVLVFRIWASVTLFLRPGKIFGLSGTVAVPSKMESQESCGRKRKSLTVTRFSWDLARALL